MQKPDEFAIHLFLTNGHREEVRFMTIQEFQKWYSNDIVPKHDSQEFITVPIRNIQGEYMVVRPTAIVAIRVEPIFLAVWKGCRFSPQNPNPDVPSQYRKLAGQYWWHDPPFFLGDESPGSLIKSVPPPL